MSLKAIGEAEPNAKAALINFLRREGSLARACALTAELIIDKHAARADLALVTSDYLHCFEIKTERDTLTRMDKQVQIYSIHADMVTVVAATRHINAALSRLPLHVGVLELVPFSAKNNVRVIRHAERSTSHNPVAMLSLMPVDDIRKRLLPDSRQRKRADVVREASELSVPVIKAAVVDFMRERYRPTTLSLLEATKRRAVKPADLIHLRRWKSQKGDGCNSIPEDQSHNFRLDQDTYRHIGESFGPVPKEVSEMLNY